MKKYLALLLLLLLIPQANARVLVFTTRTFDVVKPSTAISLIGTAVNYHRISWSYTGTVSTCQVELESSVNNSTWVDLITTQACTTAGMATAVTGSHNYVRINLTTLTGGGMVSVTYEGFSTDPSAAVGAGSQPAVGNLDMANFLVTNIGNAGTDFTTGGGLKLAGTLDMSNGVITNIGVAGSGFIAGGHLVSSGYVEVGAANYFRWAGRSRMYSFADGNIVVYNSGVTGFGTLQFGCIDATCPGLTRNGTTLRLTTANGVGAGVSFGIGGIPVASTLLELVSTTQGLGIMVMTTTERNAIASPREGLLVYDITLHKLCIRTASAWEVITSS